MRYTSLSLTKRAVRSHELPRATAINLFIFLIVSKFYSIVPVRNVPYSDDVICSKPDFLDEYLARDTDRCVCPKDLVEIEPITLFICSLGSAGVKTFYNSGKFSLKSALLTVLLLEISLWAKTHATYFTYVLVHAAVDQLQRVSKHHHHKKRQIIAKSFDAQSIFPLIVCRAQN